MRESILRAAFIYGGELYEVYAKSGMGARMAEHDFEKTNRYRQTGDELGLSGTRD